MSRLAVVWEGGTVGHIEDPVPDMWYLEGKWRPGEGTKTEEFLRAARHLDVKKSVRSGSGVRVELVEAGAPKPFAAVVMAPPGETIFVRRVFGRAPERRWRRLWRKLTGG